MTAAELETAMDLRPCPFCTSPAVEMEEVADGNERTIEAYVVCDACGASGPNEPTTERAAMMWNSAIRMLSSRLREEPQ